MNNTIFKSPYLPTLSSLSQQVLNQNYCKPKRFVLQNNDNELGMHFTHGGFDNISFEKSSMVLILHQNL